MMRRTRRGLRRDFMEVPRMLLAMLTKVSTPVEG
jgi:hypothetical protein